ncbi:hypothetical protein RclHR1_19800002 [Rhizophagus clarus]|uniref:Uncharacterized protein n=1 Tax=Rhizophagus clarus TaxID=94130 RepID=A0A2Z6QQ43_9GLOM|nr:hypothetical protein RclHR1_19800002 [Rhizophagus clarus]
MPILKEHLANHCLNAPALVLHTYMVKIRERINTSNKKKKADTLSGGQTTMKDFYDSTEFLEGQKNQINRALIKFFVACGVSFRIVEHLFFVDFVKELNAAYNLPS